MPFRKSTAGRRRFLEATGVAIGSLLGSPRGASSSPSPTLPAEVALVEKFLLSWSTDMPTVLSFLDDDCRCRLTQWGPERRGHRAIAEAINIYVERPQTVITKIIDCSLAGPIVVAHHQNRYVYEHGDLVWEGVTTFYVRDNKIKDWRGYTIRVG